MPFHVKGDKVMKISKHPNIHMRNQTKLRRCSWGVAILLAAVAVASAQVSITEHPIPAASGSFWEIAAGSDGALWITEMTANKIGRYTIAGGFTEYTVPTANSLPYGITAGPDGALWFTEVNACKIGRITTSGVVTEFPIPTANSAPFVITTGPDGNLWFTELQGDKIGKISPMTGDITEYPIEN